MEWSEYQIAFFNALIQTNDSILLEAVAGSGKSTTIVEGVSRLPKTQSVSFLAFNKSIAAELAERMPENASAKTFHSVGFGAWMRAQAPHKVKVDNRKVWKIIRDILTEKENELYGAYVSKLVGYAKNKGVGKLCNANATVMQKVAEYFGLFIEKAPKGMDPEALEAEAIEKALEVLAENNRQKLTVDFDDMLYLPLIDDVRFTRHDVVFVDEAQDTNAVQLELMARMVKSTGRVIAVGDSAQAIYGFRGASSTAMRAFKERFNMRPMPLTVSYRCARSVVAEAQQVVEHIEAADSAPEGSVTDWTQKDAPAFTATDAVLCRTTAPLFAMAYRMIAKGHGCRILGREIGEGLISLVKKMNADTVDQLADRLEEYRTRETEKHLSRDREAAAEAVNDRVECLTISIDALPEDKRTVGELVNRIRAMFDQPNGVTTLATVHKSKGLEWDRVFIYRPELMPHPMAKKDWQKAQEVNLQYVAITRAKRDLVYLPKLEDAA